MQFLCNPKHITPRLKYTVDFLFTTLGFNLEIISTSKFKRSNQLVIGYLENVELQSFKNTNLINIANFNQLYLLEEIEKTIKIFKVNSENIPILGRTFNEKKGVGWKKNKKENYYSSDTKIWQLEYDIVSNIFYHLSRYEERWRIFPDEKESDWTKSILTRADNLRIPVVDVLINEFINIIYAKCKKFDLPLVRILPWPNSEKFAVAFTHDVDLTRGFTVKEFLVSKTKSYIYKVLNRSYKKEENDQNLEEKHSNVWSFPQIRNFYVNKNWKATFFFIAKMFEGRHLRYDISSRKFQNLFAELKSDNHEIALHPSLKAFENPEKYKNEKQHLEKNTNSVIKGMRQHYLRFKVPRIWDLTEMANLGYDSSLGYNFQEGFRAGTTNCFPTFDYKDDRPIKVLEFPIAFFEYNLPQQGQDKIQSKQIIEKLVKHVENNAGLLNVLIHPSNFLVEPFKDHWQFFIGLLEKKKIFVTTLSDFSQWYENKQKIKLSLKKTRNKIVVNVKKPKSMDSFSIELSMNGQFEKTDNVEIKKTGARKYLCKTQKSNFSLNYNLK